MYCCVLTYIRPNHLYLLVVCIKTPFKFLDDQKVFVYYKHMPTNTDQWKNLCVIGFACIGMYAHVLFCIVVYQQVLIHMVCIYW